MRALVNLTESKIQIYIFHLSKIFLEIVLCNGSSQIVNSTVHSILKSTVVVNLEDSSYHSTLNRFLTTPISLFA